MMIDRLKKRNILTILTIFWTVFLCFGFICIKMTAVEAASSKGMLELWKNEKFSSISVGEAIPEYADFQKVPEKAIKVVASGHNATVNFENIVNIKGLTKNDAFISIFIAPSTLGTNTARYTQDFGKIKVRLTDAEDESNYIEMLVQRSIWGLGTFWQAGTSDVSLAGRGTYGGVNQMLSGNRGASVGGFGPFYGQGAGNSNENVPPITIRYDDLERAVYAVDTAGKLKSTPVRDLDSAEDMGAGFEWKGFSSGRVKVSISALDFYSATGVYYITEFFGLDVSKTVPSDVTSPILQTEADDAPEILTGVLGRSYPIFDGVADDMISGTVPVKKEIIKPNSNNLEPITGEYYMPTVAGEHKLIYSAVDDAGNLTEKTYTLKVLSMAPKMSINLETSLASTAFVGENVYIPKAMVSGGIYKAEVEVEIEQKQLGIYQKIENNFYIPENEGTYVVKYKATDFLGFTADFTSEIEVKRNGAPIYEFPILPTVFIADKVVKLPQMNSWDYINSVSYRQNAIVEVYESKTAISGEAYGEEIEDLSSYKPQLSSSSIEQETLYITYVTYCKGYESEKVTKTYPVKLVQLKQMYNLFEMKNITPSLADSHIKFSAETDKASMTYGLPISARQSEIVFDIEKAYNNFDVLRLTFTDSENVNQKVQLDITKTLNNPKSNVYIHGIKYSMYGSFDETPLSETEPKESFQIKFSEDMKYISDSKSNKICYFSTYLNGDTYQGFDSGKFYVNIEFIGVTGDSAINLKKFGINQPVKGFMSKGEFVNFTDTGKPYIYISGQLSQVANIYERVYVPAAYAYDVIDMSVNCFVEVLNVSNGKVEEVVSLTAAEEGVSFVPNEYGIYTIRFTAKDIKGNSSQRTLYVYVDDAMEPTIVVDGSYKKSYEVQSKITILNAIAQDLQSETVLNIFIIEPTGNSVSVQIGDKFLFEKKGRYSIRYCAYDTNYNYCIVDFQIDVK